MPDIEEESQLLALPGFRFKFSIAFLALTRPDIGGPKALGRKIKVKFSKYEGLHDGSYGTACPTLPDLNSVKVCAAALPAAPVTARAPNGIYAE